MTPEDVWKYYGNSYQFKKKTGMSDATLRNWMKWGFVPEDSQYKLERLTKGELKTEWTKDEQ
jgi:hypothetical protein